MFPSHEPPKALGGFDILERLGAGGMGEVFLARSKAGKLVAIKVLADEGGGHDERFSEALAREASLCVRLNHPAIVQVRAFVEDEGRAALVFEYVEGVALIRLLRFCARHGVRLPDRAAWHVVERVLAALAYAHAQKDEKLQPAPIVHRDVSPANVLVAWDGSVKLGDFGMAKMLGVSPATRLGVVKGTLGCMSPEQARGEAVTERADVYAAALLAWRLATGRTPFAKYKDDEIELLRAMRNPRLRPLSALRPDLPGPVLAGIALALEPEAEARAITADELRAIVRSSVDCDAGRAELGELLEKWRPALVESVAHGARDDSDSRDREGEGTSRYEEAALAFDDEGVLDGPTFETYSLPSDAAILATLPVDGPLEVAMPPRGDALGAPPDSLRPPLPPATLASVVIRDKGDRPAAPRESRESEPPSERTAVRAMRARTRRNAAILLTLLALGIGALVTYLVTQ
jgi:serine/threonine protein kinase